MSNYPSPGNELDEFVDAFDAAWASWATIRATTAAAAETPPGVNSEPPVLRSFLPDPSHSLYLAVLRELVRVDMEYRWRAGRPRRMDDYEREFPQLFSDSKSVQDIAFEEYRLRRLAGENPRPMEYQQRWGAITVDWPKPAATLSGEMKLSEAARAREKALEKEGLDAALAYLETLVRQAELSPNLPGDPTGPPGVPG